MGLQLKNAIAFNIDSNDVDFKVGTSSSSHSLFVQGSDGNVGIGTNSPNTSLHVKDGSIKVEGAGTAYGFVLQRAGDDTYEFRNLGGGLTIFNSTDGRREMFFDGDGNVGIGTTAPLVKLDIRGDISGSGSFLGTGVGNRITNNGTTLISFSGRCRC